MWPRFLALVLLTTAWPAAADPFDGSWIMSADTLEGSCGTYTFDVGIIDGRIQTPPNVPISGTGSINAKGAVNVQFTAASNVITASGHASKGGAFGRWTAPSMACAGSWRAQRR